MRTRALTKTLSFVLTSIFCVSCAPTYYQSNYNFNSEFERGDLQKALEALQADEKQAESKSRFVSAAFYANNFL